MTSIVGTQGLRAEGELSVGWVTALSLQLAVMPAACAQWWALTGASYGRHLGVWKQEENVEAQQLNSAAAASGQAPSCLAASIT
jgi:hypothetical protein